MAPAEDPHEIPAPIVSDYIQLVYLSILFAVGAPLNLAACSELRSKKPHGSGSMARLHLLKVHLNFTDLLVVFVFAPSQICWLLTYDWRGGDIMCRVTKFLHSFSFQVSSNIIVCIALNRLSSVLSKGRSHEAARNGRRVRVTLVFAWILGALICAPQLFLWEEFAASPNWKQCVTVWQIRAFAESRKANFTQMHESFYPAELAYNVGHLLFVFWLPVAIIALSYAIITHWLWQKSGTPNCYYAETSPPISFGILSKQERMIPKLEQHEELIEINPKFHKESLQRDPRRESAKSSRRESAKSCHTIASEPRRSMEHATEVRKVRRNAIRVSLLLVSAYIVTWLPYHVLSLWELIDREHFHEYTKQLDFAHGVVVLNSVINPYLYGMFGRFKRYTRSG